MRILILIVSTFCYPLGLWVPDNPLSAAAISFPRNHFTKRMKLCEWQSRIRDEMEYFLSQLRTVTKSVKERGEWDNQMKQCWALISSGRAEDETFICYFQLLREMTDVPQIR